MSRKLGAIHIVEDGHGRESSNFFDLTYNKRMDAMEGDFYAMVADQRGTTKWKKEKF